MALPKLNELPSYDLIIPSTGKSVSYRPFLVKEQKVLLIALESQDEKQILKAVVDTISSCIQDPIKIESLSTFDIEYIFTQLRSKSAGEKTTVNLKCLECDEYTEVSIDLDEIKIEVDKSKQLIPLTDEYIIKMKYPQYAGLLLPTENESIETMTDALFEMIIMCLDELRTEEEIIRFSDESREEIENFLEGLTPPQLDLVMKFIRDLPKLEHEVEFECEACTHKNSITLRGLQDFF